MRLTHLFGILPVRNLLAVIVAAASSGAAFAGGPSLPIRRIDRPFTLPADTNEASIGGGASFVRRDFAGKHVYPIIPGGLAISINDRWTWDVPTGLRYQIHHDETNTAGVAFGLSEIGYVSGTGLILTPMARLYFRRNFSPSFALESTLGGYHVFSFNGDARGWGGALRLSGVYQLNDSTAIAPRITLNASRRVSPIWHSLEDRTLPSERVQYSLPLGLNISWRFHRRWELAGSYDYFGVGYTDGYSAHNVSAEIHYYW